MEVVRSTPHGDKLKALLFNPKLPSADRPRVEAAIESYNFWKKSLTETTGDSNQILETFVHQLNEYKLKIEFDLIFCAKEDFLYRSKGQTKIDNTILEEFLPYLFDVRLVPGLRRVSSLSCGPHSAFAGLSFGSPFLPLDSGGVYLKRMTQDFSVSKAHVIKIKDAEDGNPIFQARFDVSHFVTEIKTNLDKTMFQGASQTAAELKRVAPGSRYIILCEYLDMAPITTKLTSIDEVIVLRKAKRMASSARQDFGLGPGRIASGATYKSFLLAHSLQISCFQRFLVHLNECFPPNEEDQEILSRGYF